MYKCQQSLITHIKTHFTSPQVRTIEEYAGQLKDAHKLTQLLPAVLVMYIDGYPAAEDRQHVFDLIVITQSKTFIKKENRNANLQLSSDVAIWLKQNPIFQPYDSSIGSYEILRESMYVRTLLADARFTIIAIRTQVKDYTDD